jgi:Type IV secretion system pilin
MKKYLPALIVIGLLIFPVFVFAQTAAPYGPPNLTAQGLLQALDNLIGWLFTILIITCVIFLIIAGFYFVTAQGDVEKVAKARRFVLYSLIGLAIAIGAWGLVNLVGALFGQSYGPGATTGGGGGFWDWLFGG